MSEAGPHALARGTIPQLPFARRSELLRTTFASLSVCLMLASFGGFALAEVLGLPGNVVWRGTAFFAVAAIIVLAGLRSHPHPRFGTANLLTASRAAATAVLAALALDVSDLTAPLRGEAAWIVVGVAGIAVALDGLDGFIARRRGETSDFGARFDMEVDAFLILVLCIFAWRLGQVGSWVLAIGLMRYAFVLAASAWPWLSAPLPPSFRRKLVCAIQGVVLCLVVSPLFPPAVAGATAAMLLALLAWSFAVDVLDLWRAA